MIGIVVAMSSEAKTLVEKWQLKKNLSSHKFQLFESDSYSLIVSGVGKINSAAATTYLLNRRPLESWTAVVNFGIAGSANETRVIGESFFINKITDNSSGRDFFPECVMGHGMQEAGVTTFDQPVDKKQAEPGMDLVDMEASGFFQASAIFVECHRISVIKIISDHLDFSGIKREFVQSLISKQSGAFDRFVLNLQDLKPENILSPGESDQLSKLTERLRLTDTMRHELDRIAKAHKIRGREISLEQYLAIEIKDKPHAKVIFEKIRRELL